MRETLLKTTELSPLFTVVLRNYGLISSSVLAKVLKCAPQDVEDLASLLGVDKIKYSPKWKTLGYQTIIRNNWQILPIEQIMELLEVTKEKFNMIYKEEDFLFVKLGKKLECDFVYFSQPTLAEKEKAKKLSSTLNQLDLSGDNYFNFDFSRDKNAQKAIDKNDGIRIVSSYNGSHGDCLLGDDLPFSEELLMKLSSLNVNGVWLSAVLYQLSPYPFDENMSSGYETRIKNLNRLIDLAAKYDIKVYIYLNEPRCQSDEFFKKGREHLRGAKHGDYYALCTSTQEVQDYLVNATEFLATSAPKLGGIFTITTSENLTNCYSRSAEATTCPRCQAREKIDIVAEVNNLINKGLKKAKSNIKLIAWNWGQNKFFSYTEKENLQFSDKLDKDIAVMCVSEDSLEYDIDNKKQYLLDYSISQIGASEKSEKVWSYAQKTGHDAFAKIQMNNSWELCCAPYIPVFPTFIKHLKRLNILGIKNYFLCWTLGSFPGGALKLASLDFSKSENDILSEFILGEFGKSNFDAITTAVKLFSKSFEFYPFCLNTLYHAPQNMSVSSPFYPTQTNMKSTMIGYPYDDISGWISPYSVKTYLDKLSALLELWQKGLGVLDGITPVNSSEKMLLDVSHVTYISLKSLYNNIIFTINRNDKTQNSVIVSAIKDEQILTKQMLDITKTNPYIGFEASNHYLFCKNNLVEKLFNLENLIDKYL